MNGTRRLVVAHYDEDLSWLKRVDTRWHQTVISKGRQVPNTGREASSFLWAMENVCYEDDGWVCFVQGRPFDHVEPELLFRLWGLREHPLQFVPVADYRYVTDENGQPHHPGLDVRGWWEDLIGVWPRPEVGIAFTPGAQFLLPAAYIRGRTKTELAELRGRVDSDPDGAHLMERLWEPYFAW